MNKPSVTESAFYCPHCGAFTTQYWMTVYVEQNKDNEQPFIPNLHAIDSIKQDNKFDDKLKESYIDLIERINSGKPFENDKTSSIYGIAELYNLNVSQCFHCKEYTVWVHNKIVYPSFEYQIEPNKDLSDKIKGLFNEARNIVDNSPRGATALLRLCVQYLLIDLGQSGKNIDNDIAELVKTGLDPVLVEALDVVRVMGNEAVHPGTIDLNDDDEIAFRLFEIINIIADQMISNPRKIKELHSRLPKNKLEGIFARNKKAKNDNEL